MLLSPWQQYLCIAGYLWGALGVRPAQLVFRMNTPGSYRTTLIIITGLVILGMVGGTLSRYIRLTIVGGVRERSS